MDEVVESSLALPLASLLEEEALFLDRGCSSDENCSSEDDDEEEEEVDANRVVGIVFVGGLFSNDIVQSRYVPRLPQLFFLIKWSLM